MVTFSTQKLSGLAWRFDPAWGFTYYPAIVQYIRSKHCKIKTSIYLLPNVNSTGLNMHIRLFNLYNIYNIYNIEGKVIDES